MEDVVVERYVDNEITVLASMAAKPNEQLVVDRMVTGNGSRVDVRVAESGPTVVDGRLKHRLRLRVDGKHVDQRPRIVGGLVKSLNARLLEVSEGGCLIESSTPVENGLAAELEVAFQDGVRSEPLRVCRCQMVPGAGPVFRIGAQFRHPSAATSSFWHRLTQQTKGRFSSRLSAQP